MSSIAFLIPTIDRLGGAERQVLMLAKGLRKRGRQITVIALSGNGGTAANELHDLGCGFITLEMRKGLADPSGWLRLNSWLREQRPDILHAHLPHAAWMARWSRLFAPARVEIDTIHTSATGTLGRRLGYRWSDWLPDRVTAVSHSAANAHYAARMVSARRLAVVHNGVDILRFQPYQAAHASHRRQLGLSDKYLWFSAGRLESVKNYPVMLQALAQVPARSRLVIAGSGLLEPELRRLSQKLGLAGRVRFIGFEPDVLPWLQAADGFVLSSLWEGLPMSLLEAGACALPSVATDVPGSRDVVIDGRTGFLAPTGSASALGAAMTHMMRLAPEQLRAIGERARKRMIDEFSFEATLDRWESLYDQLVGEHPNRSRRAVAGVAAQFNSSPCCDDEPTARASEV